MRVFHLVVFLVSPMATLAAINIMIETDKNNELQVTHSGSDNAIINAAEIRLFHLTQDILRDAARRFFGGRPIDVFLHDPVYSRNRYAEWGYQPVKCRSQVTNARIRSDDRATASLMRNELRNDHPTQNVTFEVNQYIEVEASISSVWEHMREVNVGKSINYGVSVAGGSLDVSWSNSMGNSSTETSTQVIGQLVQGTVVVPPNTTVTIEILATRSVVEVLIDYMLDLSGIFITWYRLIIQGRRFWGHNVRNMLGAAFVPWQRPVSESIQLGYHFDAAIHTYNAANQLLESKKMKITSRPKRAGEMTRGTTVQCLPLE